MTEAIDAAAKRKARRLAAKARTTHRAYVLMLARAEALGWPRTAYRDDLVWDGQWCARHLVDVPFAWMLHDCGSHIVEATAEPVDGVGHRAWEYPGWIVDDHPDARWFFWDGACLLDVASAEDLAQRIQSAAEARATAPDG